MTSRSSMKLMIRMIPRHFGQAPIFWISQAQLFRYSFELLQFQLGEKEREAVEWGRNQEARENLFHVVSADPKVAHFEKVVGRGKILTAKDGGER